MFAMMDGGASARILAHLGYDFPVFDLQHSAYDLAGIEAVLGGVKGTDCAPIARVHPRRLLTPSRASSAPAPTETCR